MEIWDEVEVTNPDSLSVEYGYTSMRGVVIRRTRAVNGNPAVYVQLHGWSSHVLFFEDELSVVHYPKIYRRIKETYP